MSWVNLTEEIAEEFGDLGSAGFGYMSVERLRSRATRRLIQVYREKCERRRQERAVKDAHRAAKRRAKSVRRSADRPTCPVCGTGFTHCATVRRTFCSTFCRNRWTYAEQCSRADASPLRSDRSVSMSVHFVGANDAA